MTRDPGTGRPLLALVTDAFGGRGGIARYNREFLTALALRDGAEDILVLPRLAPEAPAPPRGIVQRPPHGRRAAYVAAALRETARRRPGTIFCGHLFMAPLALAVARVAKARLVLQLHGIELSARPARALRHALERADLVLCVSRDTRRRLLEVADVAPERARIVPNTVDDAFRPGDTEAARASFGFGDAHVILSVGRLHPSERYKGHDRVIAALPRLLQRRDILYAVGGDGEDRARLEAQAAALGITDRVRFLGYVPDERLPDLYRAADLFVLPSTGEGFGIVYLEAMACGTPAIGLAVAGAADALADGALGAAPSPDAFEDALEAAVDAPPPDPRALSSAVRARFGRPAFRAAVDAMWTHLPTAHQHA